MSENFFDVLKDSGYLELVKDNSSFEFDSGTDSQKYVPKIKALIGVNSLLQTGTWAYLGSVKDARERYLFWTSLDINAKGVQKEIVFGWYRNTHPDSNRRWKILCFQIKGCQFRNGKYK